MLKTIAFGEALIDMLSSKTRNAANDKQETFTKYAGGAPANVAAAIGRLGGDSYFAGKIGEDMFGEFIRESFTQFNVKDNYILSTADAKTALAFVSLDEEGERTFSFYRDPSADMLFSSSDFQNSWFEQAGYFHFCSNTLTADPIYNATLMGLKKAHTANFCISFDVNLRKNLWPQDRDALAPIWQCIERSHIVKLCAQEMDFICNANSIESTLDKIFAGAAQLVLLTDGAKPLQYFVKTSNSYNHHSLTPPTVQVVDSTAAGDAFMGGFLYQLTNREVTQAKLSVFFREGNALKQALTFASHCGAFAASHKGALTSLPHLENINL
jgi:fructokinase